MSTLKNCAAIVSLQLLTELDEWGIMSDDDMEDEEEAGLDTEKKESKGDCCPL